jgi:phage gp16-like protein
MVKIAQKQLGLTDDQYRNLLADKWGVDSCTKLTLTQLNELVDIFRGRGFTPKVTTDEKGRNRLSPRSSHKPQEDKVQADKIRAEWIAGHREGAVRDGSEQALQRFIRRTTGLVAGPDTLWPKQANAVIEGIKKIRERHKGAK